MDHEYSISGKFWKSGPHAPLPQEYLFADNLFVIYVDGSIAPKDPRMAEHFSEEDLCSLCSQLSQKFNAQVRLEKLHEEYGLLNVFNGGSDYEVVSADRFVCECLNGKEISRVKEVF